jgi:thiol-disulfide isomerase/thioredoxin
MPYHVRTLGVLSLAAVMFASAGLACANPPTDEQVEKSIARFKAEGKKLNDGKPDPKVAEFLEGITIAELSATQLSSLSIANVITAANPELRASFAERLGTLAKESTLDGAIAASVLPSTVALPGRSTPEEEGTKMLAARAKHVAAAISHPKFEDAVKAGHTAMIFRDVAMLGDSLEGRGAIIAKLAPLVTADWPVARARELSAFASAALGSDAPELPASTRETLRSSIVAVFTKASTSQDMAENDRKRFASQVELYNGAAMRGMLVGHPAPKIDVIWGHGTESSVTGFDTFKGKIVVVDFWATWCGPCIAAFPHMREMQARYAGKDVVLLGVTSLQGFVIDHKATDPKERRKVTPTQEAELALMSPWISDMEVTWPIIVTKQNCFNPDFAVSGIPHMALIDPDGKVYMNNLSPWDKDLEDKIDALLTKFGRPVPPKTEKE